MEPSTAKISLIDYAALAADVRARQQEEGLDLNEIAAQSGVLGSRLSNLVCFSGALATDSLLLICDWLGKSLDDYRLGDVPEWVLERIAEANEISPEESERLVAARGETARRQWALSQALSKLDIAKILAAQ